MLQGHPYRNVLDLRHGASTSLIELEFASHIGKDSDTDPGVPTGLPFYTLKAQLRELELVFLNRFMQVCVSVFLVWTWESPAHRCGLCLYWPLCSNGTLYGCRIPWCTFPLTPPSMLRKID